MTVCKSCRQPIRWARTEHDRPIPLDPEPRQDGNIVLRRLAFDGPLIAHVLGSDEEPPAVEARYVSHFATCPDAAEFRRRAKAEGRAV